MCTQLGCLERAGWWPNLHILEVTEKYQPGNGFRSRFSTNWPQMQLIERENNPWTVPAYLCYFKRRCRFGLTDVTGCNSAKSPLHWWIMSPWLGSSEILFWSFLLQGMRCRRRSVEKVNINTKMGQDEQILRSIITSFPSSYLRVFLLFISCSSVVSLSVRLKNLLNS